MHQKSKIQRSAVAVYILVSALFLLFFIYIAVFENTDVFQARDPRPYTVVRSFLKWRLWIRLPLWD